MNQNIIELREVLIKEARNSPMLLSDLAGLEAYVSESYNNRSFIELLQNADDAGACKFCVKRYQNYLLVANDGREFNINDLESLCRSAASTKTRGSAIGYRGIGFKSVVSFAKEVHLISGEYEITFSKELTKEIIKDAKKVPLIRIPHKLQTNISKELNSEIFKVKSEGYNTIFIFSGVTANQIDEEYTSFAYTTLMFLNNIRIINIDLSKDVYASIHVKEQTEGKREIRIVTNETITDWLVCYNENCSIAFSVKDGKIERLSKNNAIIHAFLPTEDSCGFGFVINGDFSTDPSRRHLIFDDTTESVILEIGKLYLDILYEALTEGDDELLRAMMPHFEINLAQMMKQSFEKSFVNQLKTICGSRFSKLRLSPSWLNSADFYKLKTTSNQPAISSKCAEITGLDSLLKYLGCKTDSIETIISLINSTNISLNGYAQIAVSGMKLVLMNHKLNSLTTSSLFVSQNQLYSLCEINDNGKKIDESYIQLMMDNGISFIDIGLCLKKLGISNLYDRQFSERKPTINPNPSIKGDKSQSVKVKDWFNNIANTQTVRTSSRVQRWRSAEENALYVLNENEFNLKDVSKHNVGYDLEGTDPNGREIFIEVKSIDYPGQKIRMTNNEFAAAQYNQDKYYLAIVLQTNDELDISLIKNPIKTLNMNRQCVQWVWECSDYEFNPMKFKIQ